MKKVLACMLALMMTMTLLVACGGSSADTSATAAASNSGGGASVSSDTALSGASGAMNNSAFAAANEDLEALLAPLPEKGSDVRIAAITITPSNPFWATVAEGYEDTAEEWGVTVDVLSTEGEEDMAGQLDIMNTVLTQDYDAIALSVITDQNMIPGIVAANEAGIPVVIVGNEVDMDALSAAGGEIAAFTTSDFGYQGYRGAEYIAEENGGSGQVAIIEGMSGAPQSDARRDGAQKAFEENGMEVVSVQQADWDRQKAYDITTALLEANPELVGIACGNDVMALGAVEALKDMDKLDQVMVVGVDFIEEAKESIEAGELAGSFAMSPYLFGKSGVLCALKAINGDEFPEEVVWTPMEFITIDNVDSMEGWK